MFGIGKISRVVCAYNENKQLVITVQNSILYGGPGTPNYFLIAKPLNDVYNSICKLAKEIFGEGNLTLAEKERQILVKKDATKISTFYLKLCQLSRETLDKKLGS